MVRELTPQIRKDHIGWECSACTWVKPLPRFADEQPPSADVIAEFKRHECSNFAPKLLKLEVPKTQAA